MQESYILDCQTIPISAMQTITPKELHKKLSNGHSFFLLDVREPEEFSICHLENSVLIPMHDIPSRSHELPQDVDMVVICHHGVRSAHIINYLEAIGHRARMYNLAGGVHAWALEVDSTMPTY